MHLFEQYSLTRGVGFDVKQSYISMALHNACNIINGKCYVSLQALIERWQYSNIRTDGHTFGIHDESSHLNMSVKKPKPVTTCPASLSDSFFFCLVLRVDLRRMHDI